MIGTPYITFDSSLFYLGLSIIILLNSLLAEKIKENNRLFVILNFIILSFVSGFRAYSVGRDTYEYVSFFENPDSQSFRMETTFRFICKYLMRLFHNPTILLLIFAIITIGLISLRLWELRNHVSYFYAFMTFYCLYFFDTMNGMRQFVAVAIIFWGTRFIQKKYYKKYVIVVIIAMQFHITAIIGLIALLPETFNWKYLAKNQKRFIIISIFLGLIGITYAYISGIVTRTLDPYMHYFRYASFEVGFRMIAMVGILIISLFAYKLNINGESEELSSLLISNRAYFVLACLLGFVGYYVTVVGRLNWYYALFFGQYFGIIVQEKRSFNRLIIKFPILFVLFYTLVNYIWFVNGGYQHPYCFVWNM